MTVSFSCAEAESFVPDGSELGRALARTTHLGVGAHQDDLELMATHGILECFRAPDRWFTGVVVTDGRPSSGTPQRRPSSGIPQRRPSSGIPQRRPSSGIPQRPGSPRADGASTSAEDALFLTRRLEQRKAAVLGEYSAQIQLAFPSSAVKSRSLGEHAEVVLDLERILRVTRPEVVYTHNLADKHDTHVAVCLRLLEACQRLAPEERPRRVIGCEVWRDLDWLPDAEKVVMPVDGQEGLQAALLSVFDSQIAGGKRYDLAGLGRRRAHATFFESHELDRHSALVFGMDLTPLLAGGDPASYALSFVQRLETEIRDRIARLSSS